MEKIIVKKKFKEEIDFESFFIKNAVQRQDYILESVYYYLHRPLDFIDCNLWLDECSFKKEGNRYVVTHKKIAAEIAIYPNKLKIIEIEPDDGDGYKVIITRLIGDKNNGEFTFVFAPKK